MFKAKNICYSHPQDQRPFFQNLGITLDPFRLHALHGKNGTGKSVLLNLLSGSIPYTGFWNGREKTRLMHQRYDQLIADHFSFHENLQFAHISVLPQFKRLKAAYYLPDFIERFQIDFNKPVSQLSGGQRQILALVMALQKPVELLLLDEPTAALDEHNAQLVFEFLSILQHTVTLLVVCHDSDLLAKYTTGSTLQLCVHEDNTRYLQLHRVA